MTDSTRNRIDTEEGIQKMLANESLAGLHQLVAERRRWKKEHPKDDLREWYVFGGRYILDALGQVHTVTCAGSFHWIQPATPRPEMQITWDSRAVPRPIDRCLHCDGEITARQLGSLYTGNYDHGKDRLVVYHHECRLFALDAAHREMFAKCFDQAFREMLWQELRAIPSGYADTADFGPWYQVSSIMLGDLTFGWRKRVIELDWSRSTVLRGVDGTKVFAGEDVTTGATLVHAWSYEKFVAYLKKLYEARGVQRIT